jgi:anti-sigma regulatory factor (Ser/Thr protein kinase)
LSSTNGQARRGVKDVIHDLLDRMDELRTRDVVEELEGSISRQAVHQHLQQLVSDGEIEKVGIGRATRYRRTVLTAQRLSTAGLDEDQVWKRLQAQVPVLRDLSGDAEGTIAYIFTEMLNNVIDHAEAATVTVRVRTEGPYIAIDVDDPGVGIFTKVAAALHSDSPLEAAQRLTLGKFTTSPERHSGEGIFFSSRAAHVFIVESGGLRWTVDNERDDWALGDVPPRKGTLVRFLVDPARARSLAALFRRFTGHDLRFDTTMTVIKLFEIGTRFVSRSEAKRLAAGLEPFERVVLDFAGVTEVGQGFVDELFRVWATAHPDKRLEPVNMSDAVRFMVERGASG